MIWDRGTWEPIEDPHAGYAKGRLKFRLHGEKLQGGWTLVRIKSRDPRDRDKSWLLIKERDETARPQSEYDVTVARPDSVTTGRTIEQIAADRDRIWESHVVEKKGSKWRPKIPDAGAPRTGTGTGTRTGTARPAARAIPGATKAALPKFVPPQLATLVDAAPVGEDWLHEIKFDGYRILCRLDGGKVTLVSRNGKDWTEAFPSIARAVPRLPCRQALIDGEVAVVLPSGTTSFNALQNAMEERAQEGLVYFAFDLLYLDGQDLTGAPLEERKAALAELLGRAGPPAEPLRYSDHVEGTGEQFYDQACRMKLEGIVSKRRREPYKSGRGRGWVKVKCVEEQEFVIGGFTDPEGRRAGLGALLLGVHEDGRLRYVGKVGTGFTDRIARELRKRLEALKTSEAPFAPKPPGHKGAHWVRPELVAEVQFAEWTPDGKLRHPSFEGLREDKPASEIVREKPEPAPAAKPNPRKDEKERTSRAPERPARSAQEKEAWARIRAGKARRGAAAPAKDAGAVTVAGVRITNPDRVLYPAQGITKRELAAFYEDIADWILPHLKGRPTTLVRCPEGVAEPCFYQKHTGY